MSIYENEEETYAHVPRVDTATFATSNGETFINQYRIRSYISSGEEASVFSGESVDSSRVSVVILALKNAGDADNRIKIHEMLNNVDGCVELLEVITAKKLDVSQLNQHDKNKYADIIVLNKVYLVTKFFNGEACNKVLRNQKSGIILQGFLRIVDIVSQMHEKNVYHFDLKPDNILCSQTLDVCIIDFGASKYLDAEHLNLVDVAVADDEPTTLVNKFTPLYAPEVTTDCVVAEKFDVYSLGCILFDILTKQIPPSTLIRHSETTVKLNRFFGPLVTDLINGMLEPDQNLRYSLDRVLDHPCFSAYNANDSISLLQQTHFYVASEIRDTIFQKTITTDNLRPQSVCKSSNIVTFRSEKRAVIDDMGNLKLQNMLAKYQFIHSDYYNDENGQLCDCKQFNQFTIPFTNDIDIRYYYRMYTEVYNILCSNPKNEDFMRFYHMIDRLDCLQCYLSLYREMLINPKNVPKNTAYSKNSIANRMSRESTILRENFKKEEIFDESSNSEMEKRYSAIEFSVDMDGSTREREMRKPKAPKEADKFKIQIPSMVSESRESQSDSFVVPPPNEALLDEDIFGGYSNVEIEMSTSNLERLSTLNRQSSITRRSTLKSSRFGKK